MNIKSRRILVIFSIAIVLIGSVAYGAVKIKNKLKEQQKKISNLEETQKAEAEEKTKLAEEKQQRERMDHQREEEVRQQEEKANIGSDDQDQISRCKENQLQCPEKIEYNKNEITRYSEMIDSYNTQIKDYKKQIAECNYSGCEDGRKEGILHSEQSIAENKAQIAIYQNELNSLLKGDCKDYQKPCE